MQPKMAKYDSTVVLRKSPYNCISKLENKHMAHMSIDSNAKNIANTGSFVSQGNIHHLLSHLHQIPHQQHQTLRHYTELIWNMTLTTHLSSASERCLITSIYLVDHCAALTYCRSWSDQACCWLPLQAQLLPSNSWQSGAFVSGNIISTVVVDR